MQGKVALVTGAAKGLGKVFSQRLAERGVRVGRIFFNIHFNKLSLKITLLID